MTKESIGMNGSHSGVLPPDKDQKATLERHLRGRQGAFESIDTVLALDRSGYIGSGEPTIPSAILGAQSMLEGASKHWSEGDRADALIALTVCAAEIVWLLESERFPLKRDMMDAWRAIRDAEACDCGDDDDDDDFAGCGAVTR